ncbi:hypothetical protein Hanom_Chr11g00981361 [Helianthus anomalus]
MGLKNITGQTHGLKQKAQNSPKNIKMQISNGNKCFLARTMTQTAVGVCSKMKLVLPFISPGRTPKTDPRSSS